MLFYILIAEPILLVGMIIYVYNILSKRIDAVKYDNVDSKMLYMAEEFYKDYIRLITRLETINDYCDNNMCYIRGAIAILNERCSNIEKVFFELKGDFKQKFD